jgi:hypothetical protein
MSEDVPLCGGAGEVDLRVGGKGIAPGTIVRLLHRRGLTTVPGVTVPAHAVVPGRGVEAMAEAMVTTLRAGEHARANNSRKGRGGL